MNSKSYKKNVYGEYLGYNTAGKSKDDIDKYCFRACELSPNGKTYTITDIILPTNFDSWRWAFTVGFVCVFILMVL